MKNREMAASFFSKRSEGTSSASSQGGQKHRPLPWVEKYRPKCMADVVYQDEVTKTLQKSITTGNLPHLLFYGPPGTGKTSTILAIARQLYGPDLVKSRILELNASDERGIAVVRTKVKAFAQTQARGGSKDGQYPCPGYKLIILDEADSMTSDAQAALRRTMEQYSRVTRFCLICNYVSRIIEPLASRCAKFRFRPLSKETMTARLKYIAGQEQLQWTDEVGDVLVRVSGGDLRRAITLLQSGSLLSGSTISPSLLVELSGLIPKQVIDGFLEAMRKKAGSAVSFNQVEDAVTLITLAGYSASQLVFQLEQEIVNAHDLADDIKARICIALAETDMRLSDGADEYLQLLSLASCIMNEFSRL